MKRKSDEKGIRGKGNQMKRESGEERIGRGRD